MLTLKLQYHIGEATEEQSVTTESLLSIFDENTQIIKTKRSYTIKYHGISFIINKENYNLRITHFAKDAFTVWYGNGPEGIIHEGNFYKNTVRKIICLFCENKHLELNKLIPSTDSQISFYKTASNKQMTFTPNHIPSGERVMSVFFSGILLCYGTVGIIIDDLYIPGKRGPGIHFHGEPAWIMYGAFLSAVANMMSVVVDHYDKRNNETNYKLFARVTQIAGWTLFGLALVLDLFVFHKITR